MPQLSDDDLRSAYDSFRAASLPDYYEKWRRDYVATVRDIASTGDDVLVTPAGQEKLWRARGISGIGPGEAVNVTAAYADPEIARAIVEVRSREWSGDVKARAVALQSHFDRTLELVSQRHSKKVPQAKLARAFAALIPRDLDTCFSWKARRNVADMVLGSRAVSLIGGGVLIADRLRRLLGDPGSEDELASRAQFVWWLHDTSAGGSQPPAIDVATGNEPLELWPATKQLRGISAVSGHHEAFRATIRAAQNGASDDDIISTLEQDMPGRSEKSRRSLFNRVRRMGFLTSRGGLWYPAEEGEELLESDPPDVLVEKLIVQTFGISHLLRMLEGGWQKPSELHAALMKLYPNWTTSFMPTSLVSWALALGLAEEDDAGRVRLSEYGREWARRLPKHLTIPPPDGESLSGLASGPEPTPSGELDAPTFLALWRRLSDDTITRDLVFDEEQVRVLHTAWHFHAHKRFVILSGLSGTGKTLLLKEYARLYCDACGVSTATHQAIVAVSPDWRDPTGLLGYFNALHAEPTFQPEPALQLILEAARHPTEPFFLILDEMNLARVEHYLAPLLSAMETCGDVQLHSHTEAINGIPPQVHWPRNLFIGGTVNMDESTHPFSDKVLDRAFTLEFWEVDLQSFLDKRHRADKRQPLAESVLVAAAQHLKPIRRHFGYRTAGELLEFVNAGLSGSSDAALERALIDRALFSKVLPRLRGDDTPLLHTALDALRQLCLTEALPVSAAKIAEMKQRLASSGLTRFWA
jgi:5-methylcytosine-specific restriction enzyme B